MPARGMVTIPVTGTLIIAVGIVAYGERRAKDAFFIDIGPNDEAFSSQKSGCVAAAFGLDTTVLIGPKSTIGLKRVSKPARLKIVLYPIKISWTSSKVETVGVDSILESEFEEKEEVEAII